MLPFDIKDRKNMRKNMIQKSKTSTNKKVFDKKDVPLEVGLVGETIKLKLIYHRMFQNRRSQSEVLEKYPELKICLGELHQNRNYQE